MSNTQPTRRLASASRETLLTLLETLPHALFLIDDATTIVYANASAQKLIGATREECVGKSLWRGAPQVVSTALFQTVQRIRQTRAPTEIEYVSPLMGTWLHVQLSLTMEGLMMQFHQGRVADHHLETFPQSGRLCLDDLESLYSEIVVLTPEGIVLEINEGPLAQAQIRREELIGQPLAEAWSWSFYPTSQAQLCSAIARASKGETVHFETVIHPREGIDHHLEIAITPRLDADHRVAFLVFVGINITARKRAEAELHVLIDAIPQLVWTARPDGEVDSLNQRWHEYTGLSAKQAQGEGWMQCLHPEDRQRVRSVWQHAVQTGRPYEVEERLRQHTTGKYRWFLSRATPVRDEAGEIVKWFGTNTGIEGQKRAEEALLQSQKRIRALIDSNIIGIVSVEVEGEVIVEANEAFLRMTGYSKKEVQNKTLSRMNIALPEQAPLFERSIQELTARGQTAPFETELVCKDGSRLPILVGSVIFQDHPRQMVAFILDNSARKELEQRKDTFLSMASHELRSPLTALKLQTTLLRRQLAKQGTLDQAPALASMETQLNTVNRLVEELLDVSKIQASWLEYQQEQVDLAELLREVANTMQHTHPNARILVRGAAQTSLMGDRDRLGQVFTNLLSNAIKYSPDAEPVEVDLSTSQDAVTLQVRDHGAGIPREQRDKIFERFYRVTDANQKKISGLGMGLYIASEIVKHYGGTITVDSEMGKGSIFTVTLPKKQED